METTISATKQIAKTPIRKRFKNVEAFQEWADEQEISYEFVNGKVVEKAFTRNADFLIIWWLGQFLKLSKVSQNQGGLFGRVRLILSNDNLRIPDLAYFTREQCFAAAKGQKPIPALAIEILSKSETVQHITEKIKDYFDSGVKVVWYVHPQNETVHVYTSTKNIVICEGDDVVSAKPAIDDFEFPASAIFNREQN